MVRKEGLLGSKSDDVALSHVGMCVVSTSHMQTAAASQIDPNLCMGRHGGCYGPPKT